MKKNSSLIIAIVAIMLASIIFLVGSLLPIEDTSQPNSRGETIRLSAPEFLQASTVSAHADIAARLDAEAGISAYFKSSNTIQVTDNPTLDSAFKVIEARTADYLVGSVGIPGYDSHFDVHVYVHRDGWILGYYLRSNPLSKIVDSRSRTVNNTLLKTAVANVASAAGAAFTDVSYYDFRYPNATHILMVAEDYANGNTFTINIPGVYGYYERGWAGSRTHNTDMNVLFKLDGVSLTTSAFWSGSSNSIYYRYGSISQSQLLPNTTHKVEVVDHNQGYGVLVIIYQEP